MVEVGAIHEPERYVIDVALGLDCHLHGRAPVQGDGRLFNYPIYFRARHCGWSFIISANAHIDAAALTEGKEPGFFQNEDYEGWAQWGDYGCGSEASYMPYEMAERLIRECVSRFLVERQSAETNVAAGGGV